MEGFFIDVELSQGITRIQVEEVPPDQWDLPYTPQFIIDFHTAKGFTTLTLRLEQGKWYDRDTRVIEDDLLRYFELPEDAVNLNYQIPLTEREVHDIGNAISRHMVVELTAYMGLFIPSFRTPTLN